MLNSIQEIARFALPYWASVLVVSREDPELLALLDRERLARWEFPQADKGDDVDRGSLELIAELESLRAEGWNYLLVPAAAFAWLSRHEQFKQYLEREYRIVQREDACLVFGLEKSDPTESRTAPDGLPLPSPEMLGLVVGATDPDYFLESGVRATKWISEMLERNGRQIREMEDILDFGCGCGRVVRHWREMTDAAICGTDYNPYLIDWCRANLPFARFGVNTLEPHLTYPDEGFDFIYAISVFTHLRESLQTPWMTELTRLLKPGGLLLLTVHGRNYEGWLDPEETKRFGSGELVVRESELSGSDFCAAFHPEQYVEQTLGKGLEMLDYASAPAPDVEQDAILFLKPAEPAG